MLPWIVPLMVAIPVLALVFHYGAIYGRGTAETPACNRKHRDEL